MIEKWLKAQEPSEHTPTHKTHISHNKSCHQDSDESNFDFADSEISKQANFDKDELSGFDISVNHSLEQEQMPIAGELPVVANEDDEPADDNKGMIE